MNGKAVVVTRESKKQKAREIYLNNPSLSRSEIINKFVKELDIEKPSAATYASQCAKEFNVSLGKEYKTRNTSGTSKKERAYGIYIANNTLPRKEIAEKIATELNTTMGAAETHCSNAARRFKKENKV